MKIWSSDIFSATLYHTLSELLLNGSDTAKQFIEAQSVFLVDETAEHIIVIIPKGLHYRSRRQKVNLFRQFFAVVNITWMLEFLPMLHNFQIQISVLKGFMHILCARKFV